MIAPDGADEGSKRFAYNERPDRGGCGVLLFDMVLLWSLCCRDTRLRTNATIAI
jgi:hypothetical protein